jgi:hypothetical protein
MNDEEKRVLVDVVFEALQKMEKEFIFLSTYVGPDVPPPDWKVQERPVAYEFYHQLKLLWTDDRIRDIVRGCVMQPEVHKGYQNYIGINFIPDFIIHRKGSTDPIDQLVVMEFKRASEIGRMEEDLNKLAQFRNGVLGYQIALEVLIGSTDELNNACEKIKTLASEATCKMTEVQIF